MALLRVSWCLVTWLTSLCPFCPWSTVTLSSVHGTHTQHEVWKQMKPRWMRWPRQCCMFPKRRDCSQPKDASPYLRGSTSFFPRARRKQRDGPGGVRLLYQPICIQSHRDVSSLLCTAYFPLPPQMQHVSVQVPSQKARHQGRSRVRGQSSVTQPAEMGSVTGSVAALLHLPGLNPVKTKGWRRWCLCRVWRRGRLFFPFHYLYLIPSAKVWLALLFVFIWVCNSCVTSGMSNIVLISAQIIY